MRIKETLNNIKKIRIIVNLIIFGICLFLTACNPYTIETSYDEVKKETHCSLKNNLLKLEPGYFSGTRRLELNLDKVDNETAIALFSLSGMNKSAFFKPKTSIRFTLINSDNSREDIRLTPIAPPQDTTSQEPIYVFLQSIGYMGVINYQEKTASHVLTQMTREQIIKISKASSVIFSVETTNEPLRGELDKQALQPFRDFVQACFQSPTICSTPKKCTAPQKLDHFFRKV